MGATPLEAVVRHVRRMTEREPDDGELLRAFLARNDQTAFAAIVRRHGPMVSRLCRRVLGDRHAAEDAFQATFLLLAQQAASIRKMESLAGWLHGAAIRLAANSRKARARRRKHEEQSPPSRRVRSLHSGKKRRNQGGRRQKRTLVPGNRGQGNQRAEVNRGSGQTGSGKQRRLGPRPTTGPEARNRRKAAW